MGVVDFRELFAEFVADLVLEEDVGRGRTFGGVGILDFCGTLALLAGCFVVGIENKLLALALDFALEEGILRVRWGRGQGRVAAAHTIKSVDELSKVLDDPGRFLELLRACEEARDELEGVSSSCGAARRGDTHLSPSLFEFPRVDFSHGQLVEGVCCVFSVCIQKALNVSRGRAAECEAELEWEANAATRRWPPNRQISASHSVVDAQSWS